MYASDGVLYCVRMELTANNIPTNTSCSCRGPREPRIMWAWERKK